MGIPKKERWTEDDVTALPSGEQDYFERKGASTLKNTDYMDVLAKAICAFANSGGGSVLVGVADNGTLEGVPTIHKGKETTKDWLEKLIPRLLNYPLQDFRVHEVEPSYPSNIPAGHVVIVIDVGDSPMAPHQTAGSKAYYYRSGSKSEPAPHFFLDLLWGRQKYPGQKVAATWLNWVIKPLLHKLESERVYLSLPGWHRDMYGELARSNVGTPCGLFSLYEPDLANQEQFLECYPEVKELLVSHDEVLSTVDTLVDDLEKAILESPALDEAYRKAVAPESLEEIRENPQLKSYPDAEKELIGVLFQSNKVERHLTILSQNVVREYGEIEPSFSREAPLWNLFRNDFMAVLNVPPVCDVNAELKGQAILLEGIITRLLKTLKEIRRQLSMRYSEPFETVNEDRANRHW